MENSIMKFSVIVPTMWMANDYFLQQLPLMINNPDVGEIIIIDNNNNSRPIDSNLNNEKVKILDFNENIFFNKSLNIGVKESKFDLICLLNDDVVFDPVVFSILSNSFEKNTLSKEQIGMIYPHPAFFNRYNESIELIKDLKLVECNQPLDGYGCCMFLHKDNYIPIPDELVQHFGDVWFHKTQLKNGRKNFWLYNWVVITIMRVTTERVPEAQQKILNDWKIAQSVFAANGIELEDHSNDSPVFRSGLITNFVR